MYLKFIFSHALLVISYGNMQHDLIIDYFKYKKVSTIVGYSCYTLHDNLSLLKNLSKIGISSTLHQLDGQLNVNILAKTDYCKMGIFLDLDFSCFDVEKITLLFSEASNSRLFGELHFWLILSNITDILNIIDDQAFGLSTDVLIAEYSDDVNYYNLYDIYNLSKERGGLLKVTLLGSWNEKEGLSIVKESKYNRRSNLNGFPLKTMFFKCLYREQDEGLEDYLDDFTRATLDNQSKYGYHIVRHLAEIYNFSLTYLESSQWLPGDPKGPLEHALVNNSIDFNGSPFTMNIPRTYLIRFVHQDWPFRTCFLFKTPQPRNIKIKEILRPFANKTWYTMALLLIVITAVLISLLHNEKFNTGLNKYSNTLIISVGTLCQQGTDIEMNHISTRIAFLSILLFSLLVYTYYSASIVSARLDEPIFKINDSLNEMGKIQLKMASEAMIYLEFFLKKPDWDTKSFYNNYWSKLPRENWYMEPPEGIRRVRLGGFSYNVHPDTAYPLIDRWFTNREICELTEVHLARPTHTAFAVTINSTILELARIGLTKISEVGLRHRHILRWSYRKPRCRKDILSASSVTIYEFAPHLLFLMVGMLASMLFFFFEIVVAHFDIFMYLQMTTKNIFYKRKSSKQMSNP